MARDVCHLSCLPPYCIPFFVFDLGIHGLGLPRFKIFCEVISCAMLPSCMLHSPSY
eukprot:m.757175 g.757175  ORF g.757175 m.757175 type:complete len:56 (-) comp59022_c0_seq1:1156-1323(-)